EPTQDGRVMHPCLEATMPSTLSVTAEHKHGLNFEVQCRGHRFNTDYPLAPEDPGLGQRPLEVLLSSLATCVGGTLALLLRKRGMDFSRLGVAASAERQDQHPTLFTRIDLLVLVSGVGLEGRSVQLLWDESGEKICPVAAMLRPAVPITVTCKVL
ncbi:MAG TPA: OsmC family protein, partial [bacterium]|nr:OsmC family protein [bacterium]